MGVQINCTDTTFTGTWPLNLSFVPSDLGSALKYWMRASEAAHSGTTFQSQPDRSGNSITITPNTGASSTKVYVPSMVGGQPGWYVTNSSQDCGVSVTPVPSVLTFDWNSPMWVAAVIKYGASGTSTTTGDGSMAAVTRGSTGDGSKGWGFLAGGTGWFSSGGLSDKLALAFQGQFSGGTNAQAMVKGSTTLVSGTSYILQACRDSSGTAGGMRLYVNGVAETPTIVSDTLAGITTVDSTATFGYSHFDASASIGMAEMVIASGNPTAQEIADMDAYLNSIYSVH